MPSRKVSPLSSRRRRNCSRVEPRSSSTPSAVTAVNRPRWSRAASSSSWLLRTATSHAFTNASVRTSRRARSLTSSVAFPVIGWASAPSGPRKHALDGVLRAGDGHDLAGQRVGDVLLHRRILHQRLAGGRPRVLVADLGAGPSRGHRRGRRQTGHEQQDHPDHRAGPPPAGGCEGARGRWAPEAAGAGPSGETSAASPGTGRWGRPRWAGWPWERATGDRPCPARWGSRSGQGRVRPAGQGGVAHRVAQSIPANRSVSGNSLSTLARREDELLVRVDRAGDLAAAGRTRTAEVGSTWVAWASRASVRTS